MGHPKFNPKFASLSVSRALGDGLFKDAEMTGNISSGLSAEPFVIQRELCEHDSFVLLGCDGFFDEVEYQEAVQTIFEQLDAGNDVQSICDDIVEMAKRHGSK